MPIGNLSSPHSHPCSDQGLSQSMYHISVATRSGRCQGKRGLGGNGVGCCRGGQGGEGERARDRDPSLKRVFYVGAEPKKRFLWWGEAQYVFLTQNPSF